MELDIAMVDAGVVGLAVAAELAQRRSGFFVFGGITFWVLRPAAETAGLSTLASITHRIH